MIIFLIQTIDNKVVHDFSFALEKSIEYHKWLCEGKKEPSPFNIIYSEKPIIPNCIPIGSVEFVNEYIMKYYNSSLKPINVPEELFDMKYTSRKIINGTGKDVTNNMFIKSNSQIKKFTAIYRDGDSIDNDQYQISELIDIDSE